MKLLFGTAGIPISAKNGNTIDGIKRVHELGLDAMELEFVRSVNISKDKAPLVKEAAKNNSVALTCHAPYYINLNSLSKATVEASKARLLNAARIAYLCGAQSVAFHPAFYHSMPAETVFENVKRNLADAMRVLKDQNVNIWIRPEVMGRISQFGTLDETIRLARDIDGVLPCVDFAHLHAREGKYNTKEEFVSVMEKIEKELGRTALDNMHIHVEGIEYGEKGEKNHLNLEDSDLNYKALMRALKNFKAKGIAICESPSIEKDAMILKDIWNALR